MTRILVILAAGLALMVAGIGAACANLRYQPGQADDGLRFVLVSGAFAYEDDLDHFAEIVRSHNPVAISFNSPGGNIAKAMEFGRLVRSFRLHTVQARGMECASACALAFMGGVMRMADPGAIGVHKSSFGGDVSISAADAVSAIQQMTAEVIGYMVEMGVDPALLQLSLQYESDDVRYLSKSEMEQYRVTAGVEQASADGPQGTPAPGVPAPTSQPAVESRLDIPEPRTGRVRHPKGAAPLKARPEGKSANIANVRNGRMLQIIGNQDRWYRVRFDGETGYMHHTWVYVDQYQSGPFGHRHIQVKSFDNLAEAESYVRAAPVPLSAYLATNGWFAITLQDTFDETVAKRIVKELKAKRYIPDDAFMTYGNTYVRKVCCG